jgi:Ca2+-binding EF-hand superfamily protein
MYESFAAVAPAGRPVISPRQFRGVLSRHGIRDPVLVQRLFAEFMEKEPPEPTRLDYREFLRACSGMDDAPTEEKLSLLFAIYDVDRSGTLSLGEMTQIFVKGEPSSAQQRIIERTERMWAEIRMRRGDAGGDWFSMSKAEGITKEDILACCAESDSIKFFFESVLDRERPKPPASEGGDFKSRLAAMQAEQERARARERQEAAAAAFAESIGATLGGGSSASLLGGGLGASTRSLGGLGMSSRTLRASASASALPRGSSRNLTPSPPPLEKSGSVRRQTLLPDMPQLKTLRARAARSQMNAPAHIRPQLPPTTQPARLQLPPARESKGYVIA